MPVAAKVEAQAKINLALRVLGLAGDGYHDIETLFLRIDLSDTVSVETSEQRVLECSDPAAGPARRNVAWLAAEGYAREAGWPAGWIIRIDKRIPIGAGLGGGSADAAAVLRILNTLCPNPLPANRLAALALQVGADVPFLLTEHVLAFGEGRGEKLTPLTCPDRRHLILAIPHDPVSTPDAYRWFDDADPSGRAAGEIPRQTSDVWSWARSGAFNDLEGPVVERHPVIDECIRTLGKAGATVAAMTGSGSAVFGVFEELPPPGVLTFPAGVRTVETTSAVEVVQPQRTG